jgi:nucleoside-diphosphate-sugar epimerase
VTSIVHRFIHVSTDEVYGKTEADVIVGNHEASQLLPTNPYLATKAGVAMLVMTYGCSYGLPIITVATPLWPSVGVKPNTWKSWRLGVFRDSRMFRARQQGAKHLALGCSWCHWKGLET